MSDTFMDPIWTQFNAVYQVLLISEQQGGTFTYNLSVGWFEFQVMATDDKIHVRIQRGTDAVGASIARGGEYVEHELDLFIMYALEWHTAEQVDERQPLTKQYEQDRRNLRRD